MQFQTYDLIYYVYIVFFGVYITLRLAMGTFTIRHWKLLASSTVALLLLQIAVTLLFNAETVRFLYPLITHLPLILLLAFWAKTKWDVALVSVITSYVFCQISRWIGLVIGILPLSPLVVCVLHIALSVLFLFLINRILLDSLHALLQRSSNAILHFGSLPIVYYLYEYFMLYTRYRYANVLALSELLPTGLVLFFALSMVIYHREVEKREITEAQLMLMENELSNAGQVIEALRCVQEQTAIYRHDMHHHLSAINHLLSAGQPQQAMNYICEIQSELDAICPVRYCENETVNLILGSYAAKALSENIPFTVSASLPAALILPDTELCAMLSNGLENAFHAVKALKPDANRSIRCSCEIRQNTLLIQICNPYAGQLTIKDGLPVAADSTAHYGCRSILAITERRNGLCSFDAANQQFTLRIAIPLILQG